MKHFKLSPSTLFIVTLFSACILEWWIPLHFTEFMDYNTVRWIGVLFLLLSLILNIISYRAFKKSQTPYSPFSTPKVLIQQGIYHFSRNPIYLALVISQIGIGLILNSIWLLISSALLMILLDRYIIAKEEKSLMNHFPEQYKDYKNKTRRWI